ncbi:MAG: class I SAM-dependent methyltransferase [Acidobacteria bacterium]|nr:class I SAM-dependent methyltransferase [Acidobacteriota bacterium]
MPPPLRHRRIPTHNQTGWASNQLNEISERFVAHCRSVALPVLDIGAAFGIATLAALETGATVIANDLEASHLSHIAHSATPDQARRLILIPGRFPRHLKLAESSLSAVHASNVLHFLTGPQLEQGFASIAHWLGPGGRLFIQASTPWQQPFKDFVPVFQSRRKEGAEWPGWLEDTKEYSTHRKLGQIPQSIHLLDDITLRKKVEAAGLQVDEAYLYRRRDLPASLFLDGRECAAIIATKL